MISVAFTKVSLVNQAECGVNTIASSSSSLFLRHQSVRESNPSIGLQALLRGDDFR